MRSAIEQISDALEPSRLTMIDVLNHRIDLNTFVHTIAATINEGVFRTATDVIAEAATRCINEAVKRTTVCQKCKSKLYLPDEVNPGSRIKCPHCNNIMAVIGPSSPAGENNQSRPQNAAKSPAQNPPAPRRATPPQPQNKSAAGAASSPAQYPNPQDKSAFGATRYNQVEAQQMLVGLQHKLEDVYKSKLGSNPKQLKYQLQLFNQIMKSIQKTIASVKGVDSDGQSLS